VRDSQDRFNFISCLDKKSIPDIKTFLRHHYGPHFYGANDDYFDWQYLQNPCVWFKSQLAEGKISVNAAVDRNTGIIGSVHVFVPFDAWISSRPIRGVWDTEWINGSGQRGLGRELAQTLISQCDVYAGFGSNEAAISAFSMLGLQNYDQIHRRVAVLDRQALADEMSTAGFGDEAAALPTQACGPAGGYCTLPGTAAIPDHVLAREIEQTNFGVVRSPAWLNWRFDRHPFITYHVITADSVGADGAAIARLEAVIDTDRVACRIIEFYAMPGREAALLHAVTAFAADHRALIVDYFSASRSRMINFDETTDCLTAGFSANPRLVPYMFQPVDLNGRNAMNLVLGMPGSGCNEAALEDFHATKGDADQDIKRTIENAPAF